jgi:hypothetical protein
MSSLQTQYLKINRAIIHTILERQPPNPSGTAELENEMVELTDYAKKLLIIRIQSAFSKDSKAFELVIKNTANDSFYGYVSGINEMTNDKFIQQSQEIATLLAETQTKPKVRGGFLIVIDGYNDLTKKSVAIVIKAEQQEVLKYAQGKVEVLEKVFLSEAQKLFKIGVIYEHDTSDGNLSNPNNFKGTLFDDQFYNEKPAEYFFKDFLGFSIDENDKIQNLRFYNEAENFIKSNIKNYDDQAEVLSYLKNYLLNNQHSLVTPSNVATQLFTDPVLLNNFHSNVVQKLPSSFARNTTLIKSPLSNRKIDFNNKIKLSGPENKFDNYVKVITNQSELDELDFNNSNYTVVKIMGKPYHNE